MTRDGFVGKVSSCRKHLIPTKDCSRGGSLESVMGLGNRDAKYASILVVFVESLCPVTLTQVYSFFTSILPNLSNRSRNQFRLCVSPN